MLAERARNHEIRKRCAVDPESAATRRYEMGAEAPLFRTGLHPLYPGL